jgi:hypothetical protein
MSQWDLFVGKKKPSAFSGKASPEEIRRYSPKAEARLIEDIQRMAKEMLADLKRNHHPDLWPELIQRCRGTEEKRIAQIRLFFLQKRGGRLF